MIDTVILDIPRHLFEVFKPDEFEPNCEYMLNPYGYFTKPYIKAINNPTRSEMKKNYKPRLTLINRLKEGGRIISLKVEFSVPKLLFGNNFDEVEVKDLYKVGPILQDKLHQMGVIITANEAKYYPVVGIHFSKNIPLTDYTSSSMIINQLERVDLASRLDLDKTTFRNGGQCLHYHANKFEIVFYDKIKDLQQAKISDKRSKETDNACQLDILSALRKMNPFEVIRMEVRLGHKKKMYSFLKEMGINCSISLETVFNESLAKKVLLHYWNVIDQGVSFFTFDPKKPIELLTAIIKQKPDLPPKQILALVGAVILIQDVGPRRLRSELNILHERQYVWSRFKKELLSINNVTLGDNYAAIQHIQKSLEEFASLKLKDFNINY